MSNNDELLREILRRSPSSETVLLVLSGIVKEWEPKDVIRVCLRARELYPENIHIGKFLADAYLRDNRFLEAESEIRKVIQSVDELTGSYLLLADILKHQGRDSEATEALKLFLVHNPEKGEGLEPEVSLDFRKENILRETVEEPAVSSEPAVDEPSELATPTLAELFFSQGRAEKAAGIYEKILQKNPDDMRSRKRFDEISSMIKDKESRDISKSKGPRQKTEKMIRALESWLEGIKSAPIETDRA